jgi:hypothetical protein
MINFITLIYRKILCCVLKGYSLIISQDEEIQYSTRRGKHRKKKQEPFGPCFLYHINYMLRKVGL